MPRRKKEGNFNEIKVECRCDNMNMWSWSLRNILNINVRHMCHTYSPFQYPPSIQAQRKGFSLRLPQSAFYTRSSCILQSGRFLPSRPFYTLSVRPVFTPTGLSYYPHGSFVGSFVSFFWFSSQQEEWISEISLLPRGDERSEPQDFELCSRFVLSLGNSL